MRQHSWSASTALMALVFCAMCAAMLIMAHGTWEAWKREANANYQRVLAVAHAYQMQQHTLTSSTEVLLNTLALTPVVRGGTREALGQFMRNLDVALPDYLGFAVFNAQGETRASVSGGRDFPSLPPEEARQRRYFQLAWKTRSFSIGWALITRGSPPRVFLPMALPILGDHDRIQGVIVAPLDMSRYARALSETTQEYLTRYGIDIRLLDGQGRIMYQSSPEMTPSVGQLFQTPCLSRAIESESDIFNDGNDVSSASPNICVVVKIRANDTLTPYMYVLAQAPSLTWGHFLSTHYVQDLLAILGSLVFALLVAHFAGRRFFSQGLERLVEVARKTQAGHSDDRNGPLQGCREIQILGMDMDAMLDTLQRGSNLLREQRAKLELALDAAQMGIWRWRERTFVQLDVRGWDILGYTQGEGQDANLMTLIHAEDVAGFTRCMQEHVAGSTDHFRHEVRVRHKNGDNVWLLFVGRVGDLMRMESDVQGVCSDITVRKRLEELEREKAEHYKQLSTQDGLTGLANRRRFDEVALAEMERCLRYGNPLSVVMTDVDHFKKVNDTYGHAAGDEVLRRFAHSMRDLARATDTVARYGGEEFVLLLPETDLAAGCAMAEKIRTACADMSIAYEDQVIHITASFGVCAFTPRVQKPGPGSAAEDMEALITMADGALYTSKHHGRNRVTACDA